VGAKWLGELRPRGKRVSQNKLNEICHPRFAFLLAYRLHRDTKSPMGVRHGKLNYNKKIKKQMFSRELLINIKKTGMIMNIIGILDIPYNNLSQITHHCLCNHFPKM